MKTLNLTIGLLFLIAVGVTCNMSPSFKEFKSETGRFSVNAPGAMTEATHDVPSAAGNLKLTTYTADLGSRAFMVSYNEYPDTVSKLPSQTLLDAVQKGAIGQLNGTLISQKDVNLDGNPGREYIADVKTPQGDGTAKSRIYLVKNRLYQVLVIGQKGSVNSDEVDKFLDSFKLTGN